MHYKSFDEARESIAEYFGFSPAVEFGTDGGKVFTIPNPGLLDDDQQERFEELQFLLESCDKGDDGDPISPYRIDGELMKPSYNVRLAMAVFGEAGYAEFKAGGGSGNRVALEWARMNKEYEAANGDLQ